MHRSTSPVRLIGDEPQPKLPHPTEPWDDRNIGSTGDAGERSELGLEVPEQTRILRLGDVRLSLFACEEGRVAMRLGQ